MVQFLSDKIHDVITVILALVGATFLWKKKQRMLGVIVSILYVATGQISNYFKDKDLKGLKDGQIAALGLIDKMYKDIKSQGLKLCPQFGQVIPYPILCLLPKRSFSIAFWKKHKAS